VVRCRGNLRKRRTHDEVGALLISHGGMVQARKIIWGVIGIAAPVSPYSKCITVQCGERGVWVGALDRGGGGGSMRRHGRAHLGMEEQGGAATINCGSDCIMSHLCGCWLVAPRVSEVVARIDWGDPPFPPEARRAQGTEPVLTCQEREGRDFLQR
jgi:hypothetical protein